MTPLVRKHLVQVRGFVVHVFTYDVVDIGDARVLEEPGAEGYRPAELVHAGSVGGGGSVVENVSSSSSAFDRLRSAYAPAQRPPAFVVCWQLGDCLMLFS